MTVIVGVSDGKRAVIAADTQSCVQGSNKMYPADSKVVRGRRWMAGFSGSVAATRPLLALAASLEIDGSALRSTCRALVRKALDAEGAEPVADEGASWPGYDTSGVFVEPAGVYHMDTTGTISGPVRYWAVGSGADYALAVMFDRIGMRGETAMVETAVAAVAAAVRFDVNCGGNAEVEKIGFPE